VVTHQLTSQTDRPTDDMQSQYRALHYIVHRAVIRTINRPLQGHHINMQTYSAFSKCNKCPIADQYYNVTRANRWSAVSELSKVSDLLQIESAYGTSY